MIVTEIMVKTFNQITPSSLREERDTVEEGMEVAADPSLILRSMVFQAAVLFLEDWVPTPQMVLELLPSTMQELQEEVVEDLFAKQELPLKMVTIRTKSRG